MPSFLHHIFQIRTALNALDDDDDDDDVYHIPSTSTPTCDQE